MIPNHSHAASHLLIQEFLARRQNNSNYSTGWPCVPEVIFAPRFRVSRVTVLKNDDAPSMSPERHIVSGKTNKRFNLWTHGHLFGTDSQVAAANLKHLNPSWPQPWQAADQRRSRTLALSSSKERCYSEIRFLDYPTLTPTLCQRCHRKKKTATPRTTNSGMVKLAPSRGNSLINSK